MPYKKIFKTAECSSLPHATHKSCEFCHAEGVPILPVRYAVHMPTENNQQGIAIPSITPSKDYPVLKTQQYILRLLRKGYLYLFDQTHQRLAAWYVTNDAKFMAFPLNATDANGVPDIIRKNTRKDEQEKPFKCKNTQNHIPASMIHWPATGQVVVWILYSEIPIPSAALQQQVHDTHWRETQMQCLKLNAPNASDIFPSSQIPMLLAENNDNRLSTYTPHKYYADAALGNSIGITFANYMANHQKKTGEAGVMIALKDDLGMFETLNYNRQLPEDRFNKEVGHAPDKKDEYQCTSSELETRRKIQCYNMFNMILKQSIDNIEEEVKRYDNLRKTPSGKITLAKEMIEKGLGDVNTPGAIYYAECAIDRKTPEKYAEELWKYLPELQETTTKNFLEHINTTEFLNFKSCYEQAVLDREKTLNAIDKEYSEWVMLRGPIICEGLRWTRNYITQAIFSKEIILRCLIGNIMTEHSHQLWHNYLLNPNQKSILVCALGLHDPDVIQQTTATLTSDEAGFIDKLLTTKNLFKLSKEVNTYISKVGIKIIIETTLALLNRPSTFISKSFSATAIKAMQEKWKPLLIRYHNIYRRLTGQTVLHMVDFELYHGDYQNFIHSLPKDILPDVDLNQLKNVATVEDSTGRKIQVSNLPYDQSSSKNDGTKIKVTLLVEGKDIGTIKKSSYNGEHSCTVTLKETNETFTIHPTEARKLERSFKNLSKQGIMKPSHSIISVFLAINSLYDAYKNGINKPEDMVSLVSSVLGMTKASAGLIDTFNKGLVESNEVSELRLLSSAPWCQKVGTASNVLGVVSAGYELINALKAWQNGEPTRVVTWLCIGASLSSITAILGFVELLPGIGIIVAGIGMLLGTLFTAFSLQALSLPQRIWLNRCIFGHPNNHYYGNNPFGYEKKQKIIENFGENKSISVPHSIMSSTSQYENLLKEYHRQALHEEIDALAMLVQGITLEVAVTPGCDGKNLFFKEPGYLQDYISPPYIAPKLSITISMPEKTDGYIDIELITSDSLDGTFTLYKKNKLTYKKVDREILPIEKGNTQNIIFSASHDESITSINIKFDIEIKDYTIHFMFSTIDEQYVPVAQDRVNFHG